MEPTLRRVINTGDKFSDKFLLINYQLVPVFERGTYRPPGAKYQPPQRSKHATPLEHPRYNFQTAEL